MKLPSPMKRTTLSSKDFSTKVIRILMVNVRIYTIHFYVHKTFILHTKFLDSQLYDFPNYPVLCRVSPICWPVSSQQLIHGDHQSADPATDLSGEKLLAAEKN